MKGVKPISMEKEDARKAWIEYRDALRKNKGNFVTEYYQMKRLYRMLRMGKKVIDIRDCFKRAGWTEKNEPRLAIASLGFSRKVLCDTGRSGSLRFRSTNLALRKNSYILISKDIMPPYPNLSEEDKKQSEWATLLKLEAKIPIPPAKYLPNVKNLEEYFVLWEVKDWKEIPKDPMLLKRISEYGFAVLAAWDLTPLEKLFL